MKRNSPPRTRRRERRRFDSSRRRAGVAFQRGRAALAGASRAVVSWRRRPDGRRSSSEFGLADVTFSRAHRASWRPYYLRELRDGLRDMQRVFPALIVRRLGFDSAPTRFAIRRSPCTIRGRERCSCRSRASGGDDRARAVARPRLAGGAADVRERRRLQHRPRDARQTRPAPARCAGSPKRVCFDR